MTFFLSVDEPLYIAAREFNDVRKLAFGNKFRRMSLTDDLPPSFYPGCPGDNMFSFNSEKQAFILHRLQIEEIFEGLSIILSQRQKVEVRKLFIAHAVFAIRSLVLHIRAVEHRHFRKFGQVVNDRRYPKEGRGEMLEHHRLHELSRQALRSPNNDIARALDLFITRDLAWGGSHGKGLTDYQYHLLMFG